LVTNNGREILWVDSITYMFSLCNPVGFSAYLITQRNHFTEPLMLYLLFGKVGRIASQNVAIV